MPAQLLSSLLDELSHNEDQGDRFQTSFGIHKKKNMSGPRFLLEGEH